MSNNKEIRIEAKTIEAAVVMACVKLGVTQEDIEYEVVKQPKTGLMSLFGGKAEIKAWPRSSGGRQGAQFNDRNGRNRQGHDRGKKPQDTRQARSANPREATHRNNQNGNRDQESKKSYSTQRNNGNQNSRNNANSFEQREQREPAEPLTAEQLSTLETEIRTFCSELCGKIVGEPVTVTSAMTPDRLQIEVDNDAIAQMIQEHEKFIESLEHILRKKPRHLKQDLPFRIFLDAKGSRKGRETDIARIALEKADQVVSTGQKAVLDFKSAADRKVVHMTLEHDERVYTKSIGNGVGRKLLILPSRGRKPNNVESESAADS